MTAEPQTITSGRWRVAWRSRATGFQGCGLAVFASREEAQQLCDEASGRWPELDHWPELITAAVRLACQWCEQTARYSINWECGHASAMCVECFAMSDRVWSMDIMDWQQVPAICPDCAG